MERPEGVMPKATLEFSLPEEKSEFDNARQGVDFKLALSDLDNWLRGKLKYEEISATEAIIFQKVRDQLHECCKDNDVSLY